MNETRPKDTAPSHRPAPDARPAESSLGKVAAARIATLFDAIAHGDDEHRAWLRQAIEDHFAGRVVARPSGLGNYERGVRDGMQRGATGALVEALRETRNEVMRFRKDMHDARDIYPASFDDRRMLRTYRLELARVDAIIDRANAALKARVSLATESHESDSLRVESAAPSQTDDGA